MAPKSLSESAKSNPTALGDPVSLKAETSDTTPTEKDRPNESLSSSRTKLDAIAPSPTEGDLPKSHDQDSSKKSLKDLARQDLDEARKGNRSLLGDPVGLKAEKVEKDPIKDDGFGGLTDNKKSDSKI
jgi:hypothetical protein